MPRPGTISLWLPIWADCLFIMTIIRDGPGCRPRLRLLCTGTVAAGRLLFMMTRPRLPGIGIAGITMTEITGIVVGTTAITGTTGAGNKQLIP